MRVLGPEPDRGEDPAGSTSSPNSAGSCRIDAYARSPSRLHPHRLDPGVRLLAVLDLVLAALSATATAVPSDGWPANGISSAGVQIRLR